MAKKKNARHAALAKMIAQRLGQAEPDADDAPKKKGKLPPRGMMGKKLAKRK